MARLNYISLVGVIQEEKLPTIVKDKDGNYVTGIAFLRVARGPRAVGDGRVHMKFDSPIIYTLDPERIKEMDQWKGGDIIHVKGTIATKKIMKSSTCPHCGTKNHFPGVLVYVNPIHFLHGGHVNGNVEAAEFLQNNGEVTNQAFVLGTLVRDPKLLMPKSGLRVTQYQIAMERKYRIKTDDALIRTDFPWVKAYGDNAVADHARLHIGSEIYVDGCLQARQVTRTSTCQNPECAQEYEWQDRAMELVPFATEYLNNYYSDEEVEEREEQRVQQAMRDIFKSQQAPEADELTQEDIDAGIDKNAL